MRSSHQTKEEWGTKLIRRIPTLVDLCVHKAIDNVRYLGDVGVPFRTVFTTLYCRTVMHIEDSTKDQDLSPLTDKLWKKNFTPKSLVRRAPAIKKLGAFQLAEDHLETEYGAIDRPTSSSFVLCFTQPVACIKSEMVVFWYGVSVSFSDYFLLKICVHPQPLFACRLPDTIPVEAILERERRVQ
ncbi:hypothetical protein E3N88_39363 [Mikania micrantha]|uniref:Uncharacterized protein n=1 Tax=Mikania micrantha TaxID=192012 RepID=A0A5N6LWK2_9ASTR|nr:hypothetical protein E3N88_39363 [Mikania micrantha]